MDHCMVTWIFITVKRNEKLCHYQVSNAACVICLVLLRRLRCASSVQSFLSEQGRLRLVMRVPPLRFVDGLFDSLLMDISVHVGGVS